MSPTPTISEGRPDEGGVAVLAEHGGPADQLVAVHVPDLGLAGLVVVPDDVGAAVAVHVADADDLEGRPDEGGLAVLAEDGCPAGQLVAVHEPDLGLAGLVVVPIDWCRLEPVDLPDKSVVVRDDLLYVWRMWRGHILDVAKFFALESFVDFLGLAGKKEVGGDLLVAREEGTEEAADSVNDGRLHRVCDASFSAATSPACGSKLVSIRSSSMTPLIPFSTSLLNRARPLAASVSVNASSSMSATTTPTAPLSFVSSEPQPLRLAKGTHRELRLAQRRRYQDSSPSCTSVSPRLPWLLVPAKRAGAVEKDSSLIVEIHDDRVAVDLEEGCPQVRLATRMLRLRIAVKVIQRYP